jgi:hypothetical protein
MLFQDSPDCHSNTVNKQFFNAQMQISCMLQNILVSEDGFFNSSLQITSLVGFQVLRWS